MCKAQALQRLQRAPKALSMCQCEDGSTSPAASGRRSGNRVIAVAAGLTFYLGLQKAGVRFIVADMREANEMVVGITAVVAQAERKLISKRTKDARAAAKVRGASWAGRAAG